MTRNPIIRTWVGNGIIADNFAGGGGVSEAFARAIGRSPDHAINHCDEALAMHRANHPETQHHCESVWDVDPVAICNGERCWAAWFSPDCTHHSPAKGGKPVEQKIRALAWVAVRWAHDVCPDVIFLENVPEFQNWGPIHQTHVDACAWTREDGEEVCSTNACHYHKPIKSRRGQTFRAFVRRLASFGYVVEWRVLKACDYGSPTSRKRLFMVARRDGRPIVWPTPTHGPLAKPYRTAGDCIDWTIPCPSIFDRDKALVAKTLARVARGADKFVLSSASPFIVAVNHGGVGRNDLRVHDLAEPMPTITGGQRGSHALVIPYLVHRSNGERVGQAPRIYDVQEPLGTIVAQGQKHALCAAFLAKHYSDRPTGGWNGGAALDEPMGTVTMRDHHSLVAAYLCRYNGQSREQSLAEPLTTIDTKDRFALVEARLEAPPLTADMMLRARQVAAFLRDHGYDVPGEFATVAVGGVELVVWDLGMRMLVAAELFAASGFPPDYKVDIEIDGKPISKTDQIRLCGNAVPPQWPEELIAANFARAA